MSKKNLASMGAVSGATLLSRVLGLGREMLIAAVFGTSALNSAFVSAFTLPNLFRRLLGEGALTAAFIPTMTDALAHHERAGAFTLLSKVSSRLFAITTVLVVVAMIFFANAEAMLHVAVRCGISEVTAQRLLLGADLAVLLFPYLSFVCLAAAFSAACQVLEHFFEPALSSVWLNLAIIGALGLGAWWAFEPPVRMQAVCVGVLVGGFLQMAVPAAVLMREGWRPRFDLSADDRVREIMRLMAPTMISSAIYLINISMSRFIGLSLDDHAASVLNLSTRVMELPIGIFTAAIAAVVFPLISRHATRGDWNALGKDYHSGLRLTLLLNLPAAAGLALLSEPIVRLLFQRGHFQASDTALMTPVLAVYALGLPFLSFTSLALRGFYAVKDMRTPVRAAALSFVVNVVLSVVLMRWLSTVGLALASNIAVVVQAWYLQTHIGRRLPQLGFGTQWRSLAKILIATAVMSAALWGGNHALRMYAPSVRVYDWLALAVLIPGAAGAYFVLALLLRIEGLEEVRALARRLRDRLVRRTAER